LTCIPAGIGPYLFRASTMVAALLSYNQSYSTILAKALFFEKVQLCLYSIDKNIVQQITTLLEIYWCGNHI